jgi:cysteine desulfurase
MIYLDHAATTPMRPEVVEAMGPFLGERFGNPSGVHSVSRAAKNALEEAREQAAELLGCAPLEVVFTAGGTESDNLAVKGATLAREGGVVLTAVEHEAVAESARFLGRLGRSVVEVGVDGTGRVDPEEVGERVDGTTALVSVMLANNETGVIQPVAEVVSRVHQASPGTVVHTDAVQAFVSSDVRVDDLGVDLLTLAGHKFGGPKGTGLLYVREGVALEPVLHGGGQELGRRSGTHDVAGAVGLVAAMAAAVADRHRVRQVVDAARRRFEQGLAGLAERTVPEGAALVQHAHLRVPGVRNESLLVRLDRLGLAASAGSACSSGAATVSRVLTAMGIAPERARESVRFSFGWTSRPEEGDQAAAIVTAAIGAGS